MIAIVLAALLWGTTGTAATLLPATVSPLAAGAATTAVGGPLLAFSAPRRTTDVLRSSRSTWALLAPGALCVALYPLAFYTSMSLAGVAIGNVVSLGTAPVAAALLERLLDPAHRRRRLQPRWVAAAAASITGVVVLALFGHGTGDEAVVDVEGHGTLLTGIACGVLAGATYAGYTCTAGRLISRGSSSRGAVAAQFGLGALLLWPVLIATGAPLLSTTATTGPASGSDEHTLLLALVGTPAPWQVIAYLALGPVLTAYLLFGRGLRTVAGSRATTLTLLEPFVATLLAVLVLGERLTPLGWVGLALVLAGVVAVALEAVRSPDPKVPEAHPGTPTSSHPATSHPATSRTTSRSQRGRRTPAGGVGARLESGGPGSPPT
ncbi:DMT family transporter [Kineococcus indalonis]|uniref:DMT family transporter n=1 Tax=Kineococcus indalonis TaxID=2696566 RepID=UPI0014132855|nr:EamA family transporter [Kineococcus indalonis]NAZ86104.1 EamA family transporter [Kineococcus indalonis]